MKHPLISHNSLPAPDVRLAFRRMTGISAMSWSAIAMRIFVVLLFAFPLLMQLVSHWASAIYYLLAIIALVSMRAPDPPLRREERIFLGIVLAYFVTTVISNTLNGWPGGSIRWFEATSRFLFLIPLYLFLRAHPGCIMYLFRAVPFAGIIFGTYMTVMTFMGDGRVYGPYNPIVTGNIAALLVVVSLATMHFPTWEHRGRVPLHLSGAAFALMAVVLSGTRGAWLAVTLTLPLTVVLASKEFHRARLRGALIVTAVAVIAAVVLAGTLTQPRVTQDRLSSAVEQARDYLGAATWEERVEASATSVGYRLEQWRAGLQIFLDYPLFGTGVGNVGEEINRRIADGSVSPAIEVRPELVDSAVHLHSAYMDALVFKGTVGFCATLLLYFFPLLLALDRDMRGCGAWNLVLGIMLVYAIISLTADPLIRNGYVSIYIIFQICALLLLFSQNGTARQGGAGSS